MRRLDGKVAFITGAARGQGRSHALRLASLGADIIGLDICAPISTVPYPLATPEDLEETARQVGVLGSRMLAVVGDVRDPKQVRNSIEFALDEFKHIDIVLANAGIASMGGGHDEDQTWTDILDVNLTGVWNTIRATVPYMIERGAGGSIILVSSTAGLKALTTTNEPGLVAYTAAKHALVGLMRCYAKSLAEHKIRVNTIHPTGVRTPMVVNVGMQRRLERVDVSASDALANLMPVALIEPDDVADAVAWLVSDEARFVTGVTLSVDAGFNLR